MKCMRIDFCGLPHSKPISFTLANFTTNFKRLRGWSTRLNMFKMKNNAFPNMQTTPTKITNPCPSLPEPGANEGLTHPKMVPQTAPPTQEHTIMPIT